MPIQTLVAGLGSNYGADAIGWLVVRALKRLDPELSPVEVASAAAILDCFQQTSRLVICDGCQGAGPPGSVHRWRWPHIELRVLKSSSTHDLSLPQVLQLGHTLGSIPSQIDLWGIEVPCDTLSSDLQWLEQVASDAAEKIYAEVTNA